MKKLLFIIAFIIFVGSAAGAMVIIRSGAFSDDTPSSKSYSKAEGNHVSRGIGDARPEDMQSLLAELNSIDEQIKSEKASFSRYEAYVKNSTLFLKAQLENMKAFKKGQDSDLESGYNTEISRTKQEADKRLSTFENKVFENAKSMLESKASEINSKLEDDLYSKRAEYDIKYADYCSELAKKNSNKVISLQLKINSVSISESDREAARTELAELKKNAERLMEAKRIEFDSEYDSYAEKRKEKALEELNFHESAVMADAKARIEEEKKQIDADLFSQSVETRLQMERLIGDDGPVDSQKEINRIITELSEQLESRRKASNERIGALIKRRTELGNIISSYNRTGR